MTPTDEDLTTILNACYNVATAGEDALGEVSNAGLGWFARDRAGMFGVGLRHARTQIVERGRRLHAAAASLMAELEPLLARGDLPRTGSLLEALQRLSAARDDLWEVLVVFDAVERLGGAVAGESTPGARAIELTKPIRGAVKLPFKRGKW